jgi:hypothetical protein
MAIAAGAASMTSGPTSPCTVLINWTAAPYQVREMDQKTDRKRLRQQQFNATMVRFPS